MIKKDIVIKTTEYNSIEEFSKTEQEIIKKAKEIVLNAYSPYSHFSVGAAIYLDNGETITGTNQENSAYPSGLCAERTAMFYANSHFPNSKPLIIAVAAYTNGDYINNPIPPCGSCRQVLLESEKRYQNPIKIILIGKDKIVTLDNATSLLPLSFDGTFLKK